MNFLKKISLTHWIFISIIFGIIVGVAFPEFSQKLQLISKIFLRLIKTIVAPLIFATIVLGIAHHSKLKDIGKLGLKSIIYFEVYKVYVNTDDVKRFKLYCLLSNY